MKTKSKTKQEKDEIKKKELNEAEDHLRMIDLPEGRGGGETYAIDKLTREEKDKKIAADVMKTYLEMDRQKKFTYRRNLARYGNELLEKLEFPRNWEYAFIPTDGTDINIYGKRYATQEGMVVILKAPDGKVFVRAVSTCMQPEYDFKAIETLATIAENTLDDLKGLLIESKGGDMPKTKDGIYLPK